MTTNLSDLVSKYCESISTRNTYLLIKANVNRWNNFIGFTLL